MTKKEIQKEFGRAIVTKLDGMKPVRTRAHVVFEDRHEEYIASIRTKDSLDCDRTLIAVYEKKYRTKEIVFDHYEVV